MARPSDTVSGLFLLPVEGLGEPLAARGRGGNGMLVLHAPPGAYLLSLELWNPAGRWASRIRHGVRAGRIPPDVPTLSDLLLLHPGASPPATLEEALPRARITTDLQSGGNVTLAWEVYGLGQRREPLGFRVSLVRQDGSLVRKALQKIGLFRRSPALTLEWSEGGSEGPGPLFRAVDLELGNLDRGSYLLQLELAIPRRNSVRTVRPVRIY